MNAAYYLKLASDEFCETLLFAGLIDRQEFKYKEKDKKGSTRYRYITSIGEVYIYSPRSIFINGKKHSSLTEARQYLYTFL